jgi:hypothetical protein
MWRYMVFGQRWVHVLFGGGHRIWIMNWIVCLIWRGEGQQHGIWLNI